jgi:hypothetical protein
LCRFTADPDELAYVVFDAEGRLGQMLLVVNARELPLPEQRLLETFLHYRRAVGEEPVELPEPSASSPAVGRVRSFDYVSCEPAFDGTRSILVSNAVEPRPCWSLTARGRSLTASAWTTCP